MSTVLPVTLASNVGIERNFSEAYVARLAAREKQIQQHYRPVISVRQHIVAAASDCAVARW
jgi:hypothetical protein